jgi:hypothetical protein
MTFLYHDVQRRRQYLELLAVQGENFAIDHDVDWGFEMKINLLCRPPLGQGMVDVSSVVERWQITDQADAPDWSPAYEFDVSVVDLGLRRDHHGAAGVFAVAEGQEQTGTAVDVGFAIDLQREGAEAKTRQADEDGRLIPDFSPSTEVAGAQVGYVGGETNT